MEVGTWIRYLFGQAEAIFKVAGSRSALWTGIALVLLTAIARNYDQTFISENPILWLLGPLLFSIVSGSWLYLVIYAGFARRRMYAPGDPMPTPDGGWPSFMGLFWMTAPIAWLYAIPVERFLDSVSAARANVTLLALVSLWRVVLMTRVMQVTTKAPFGIALVWILFAASVEVLVISAYGTFSGGLAERIMAAMSGMRNSPEEEIMRKAMNTAFGGAFWIALISVVIAFIWRPKEQLRPLSSPAGTSMPWTALAIAACLWVAIAVNPQRELARTVAVEQLMAKHQAREALDILAAHQPGDFAPARVLPPKPFERSVFDELPECFGVVQASDPPWVRVHLVSRLDVMISHLRGRWGRRQADASMTREEQIEELLEGLSWHSLEPNELLKLVDGLERFPEGWAWLETNSVFTEALWRSANDPETLKRYRDQGDTEQEQISSWLAVSNRLHGRFVTNTTTELNR